jgi:DNA-binding SARP family transcriptional activator
MDNTNANEDYARSHLSRGSAETLTAAELLRSAPRRARGNMPVAREIQRTPIIKIYALGAWRIEVGESPLRHGRKTPKKCYELLQALVIAGRRGASNHALMDQLWDNAPARQRNDSLRQCVTRTRLLLADDQALWARGVVALDATRVWIDLWALEQLLEVDLSAITDAALLRVHARSLDRLYQGDLLPGGPAWAAGVRARLRERYIDRMLRLGGRLEDIEHWRDALEIYDAVLSIDSFVELAHQGVMRCNLHAGDIARGLAAYDRLRSLIQHHWQQSPSAASRALYDALRAGAN